MFILVLIIRELCTIIKRHALIDCYFKCSLICLNICKKFVNMAIFKVDLTVFLLIKS